MRPQNPDGRRTPAAAGATEHERRRLRWFVAAHVGLVAAIYGTALAVGDGLADPPFPPQAVPAAPASHERSAQAAPRPVAQAPASPMAQPRSLDRGAELLPPPVLSEPGPALPALRP